jgi:hypothetical protein
MGQLAGKLAYTGFGVACAAVVALEAVALAGWQGWRPSSGVGSRVAAAPMQAVHAAAALPSQVAQEIAQEIATRVEHAAAADAEETYYGRLRAQMRWVPARVGDAALLTPDAGSRLLLAKSAAERAGLDEVGLGFKDVYGIINAETSWVSRLGASKDGTPNLGIAQFEPATARALGLRDPDDPVEAVHMAALHMKQAAQWSRDRIAGLKLGTREREQKLREGVSIYYNLSSRGRSAWNGRNTRRLPRETQLHIRNARIGAQQADQLETQLRAGQQQTAV